MRRVSAGHDTVVIAPTCSIVVPSRLRDVHERKGAASSVIFRSPVANNTGVSKFIHLLGDRVVGVALDGVHMSTVRRDYEPGMSDVLTRAKEDLVTRLGVRSVPSMRGFVILNRVRTPCAIRASVVEDFLGVSGIATAGFVDTPSEEDGAPIVAILRALEEMRVSGPEVAGIFRPVALAGVSGFLVEISVGCFFQVTNFLGGDADNIVNEYF